MNHIVEVRDLEKYIDNQNSVSLHMDMSMNVLLWESFLLQEEKLEQTKQSDGYQLLKSGKEIETYQS